MIKCVIFDIHDTLYNGELIFELLKNEKTEIRVLEKNGFNVSIEEYINAVRKTFRNWNNLKFKNRKAFLQYNLLENLGIKPNWKLARKMRFAYHQIQKKATPKDAANPNTIEIINWVSEKKYYLGIISDASSKFSKRWLRNLGLIEKFHHISLSCETRAEKGKSEKPFRLFLKKMLKKYKVKLKPEECLMIGNGQEDLKAKLIGMKTCLYNPKGKDISYYSIKPDFQIKDFNELKNILSKW